MESIEKVIEEVSTINPDVLKSFTVNDELNPKLWDGDTLKKEVRNALIKIAYDFFKGLQLKVPVKIYDIVLTGSSANYNWSKYSDLDVHIRLDFKDINKDEVLVKKMFDLARGRWNELHDVTIYDIPVELYVEDVDEDHRSSGLYSLAKEKWISVPPKGELKIDLADVKTKATAYLGTLDYLDDLMNKKEYEKVIIAIDKIKDRLKAMRMAGLTGLDGEYSVENLAFKVLRRNEYIGQIIDLKREAYDKLVSLNK